ncbi:hypothetical protein [Glycomyces algeriensis]|uniref:Uncharacterized protein n=1 Tax=Glycomyces algeriensis TaxID=256037 RepID=A0A9W6LF57_9ACTN|nr:hypothetical protein [Glycomyces algeriensis]MDA1366989.1 hypothetical protein [Glycomyces algeriensis]MDR7352624.1 hypothetical protein [Glycomyces algeriensis]GLI40304.1 hypothetical protein GALLR39Z86_01540 [Glycomyces algeriensis]
MPSASRANNPIQQGAANSTTVDYYHLANLANRSYQAAEAYGELLACFANTYTADPDLCDAEGTATVSTPEEVVSSLLAQIEEMKTKLTEAEDSYVSAAKDVRNALNSVPSELLELYDLPRNESES